MKLKILNTYNQYIILQSGILAAINGFKMYNSIKLLAYIHLDTGHAYK
mgnify:CR=1 FL=1